MLKSKKLQIILFAFILNSCRVSTRLYTSDDPVSVKITSSCRNPVVTTTINENELKNISTNAAIESSKKLKIKKASTLEKADYKLLSTALFINEQCASGSGSAPLIKISQVIRIETVKTGELLELSSDTTLIDQQSLTQPTKKAPAPSMVIPALTEENYKKLKVHMKR
jgi:hypothetical protein